MIRENQQLLNQFNVLTDAVAVFLAMLVSYWLRFDLFRGIKGMPFNYYVWLGVVAAALTLLIFAVAGLYESFRAVRLHVEVGRVVVLELLVALIVMAAMFVLRLGETSRWSVAFFYGCPCFCWWASGRRCGCCCGATAPWALTRSGCCWWVTGRAPRPI